MSILLGFVMIFLIEGIGHEVRIACTIWCIWSILREVEEIFEKVIKNIRKYPVTSVINFSESIIIIIFSIILLTVESDELVKNALKHVYLLGVEFILEVVWPYLTLIEEKLFHKEVK